MINLYTLWGKHHICFYIWIQAIKDEFTCCSNHTCTQIRHNHHGGFSRGTSHCKLKLLGSDSAVHQYANLCVLYGLTCRNDFIIDHFNFLNANSLLKNLRIRLRLTQALRDRGRAWHVEFVFSLWILHLHPSLTKAAGVEARNSHEFRLELRSLLRSRIAHVEDTVKLWR